MENTRVHKHWSAKEIRVAKKALKQAKGNQKKAARAIHEELGRPLPSTIHKMCELAKKHPSLRRKHFKKLRQSIKQLEPETTGIVKRRGRPRKNPILPVPTALGSKHPRIEVHGDHIRIYL